jgi:hypothetical protein
MYTQDKIFNLFYFKNFRGASNIISITAVYSDNATLQFALLYNALAQLRKVIATQSYCF